MKKKTILILLIACFVALFSAQAQNNILYLCSSDAPTKDQDIDIVDSLTSYGYVVTVVAQNTFRDEYITLDKFTGFDAFVISESISSDRANNFEKLGYPLPCLNMEGYTPRDTKWSWFAAADEAKYYMNYGNSKGTGVDGLEDAMTIVIEDNSHYITKEYTLKEEVAWSVSPDWLGAEFVCLKLETLIPGAIALASSKAVEFDGFSPLWAIPENSPVPDTTSVFAHRMVIFTNHVNVIGADEATADFYNIIKRSMSWILKEDGTSAIVNTKANALDVALLGNPVSDYARFKLGSENTGAVTVTVLSMNGQVLLSQSQSASAGNVFEMNTSSLDNGLYLYTVVCNDKLSTGKMLVNK